MSKETSQATDLGPLAGALAGDLALPMRTHAPGESYKQTERKSMKISNPQGRDEHKEFHEVNIDSHPVPSKKNHSKHHPKPKTRTRTPTPQRTPPMPTRLPPPVPDRNKLEIPHPTEPVVDRVVGLGSYEVPYRKCVARIRKPLANPQALPPEGYSLTQVSGQETGFLPMKYHFQDLHETYRQEDDIWNRIIEELPPQKLTDSLQAKQEYLQSLHDDDPLLAPPYLRPQDIPYEDRESLLRKDTVKVKGRFVEGSYVKDDCIMA